MSTTMAAQKQGTEEQQRQADQILRTIDLFKPNNITPAQLDILMAVYPSYVIGNSGTLVQGKYTPELLANTARRLVGRSVMILVDNQWHVGTLLEQNGSFGLHRSGARDSNIKLLTNNFNNVNVVDDVNIIPVTGTNANINAIYPTTACYAYELFDTKQELKATKRRLAELTDNSAAATGAASSSPSVKFTKYKKFDDNPQLMDWDDLLKSKGEYVVHHPQRVYEIIKDQWIDVKDELVTNHATAKRNYVSLGGLIQHGYKPELVFEGLAQLLIKHTVGFINAVLSEGTNMTVYYKQVNTELAEDDFSKARASALLPRNSRPVSRAGSRAGSRGGFRGGFGGGSRPSSRGSSSSGSYNNFNNFNNNNNNNNRGPQLCFYCHKPGHRIHECRVRIANEGRRNLSSGNGSRPSSATSSN